MVQTSGPARSSERIVRPASPDEIRIWFLPLALWLALAVLIEGMARRARALGQRAPWARAKLQPLPLRDRDLRLAFLGDLQRGVVDVPRGLARALGESPADYVISSGDLASHGEAPWFGLVHEALERADVPAPLLVVPGNHDLFPSRCRDDRIGGPVFQRFHGSRSWCHDLGPVLVVGLDTGTMWRAGLEWDAAEAWLDRHPDKAWILVTHRPPWRLDEIARRPYDDLGTLPALWAKRPPALYVCGHLHKTLDETIDGVRYIVNAQGGHRPKGSDSGTFQLLRVTAGQGGRLDVRFDEHPCERDGRILWLRFVLRVADARRRPWVAALCAPAHLPLRALGWAAPIVRHPLRREQPTEAEARQWLKEEQRVGAAGGSPA